MIYVVFYNAEPVFYSADKDEAEWEKKKFELMDITNRTYGYCHIYEINETPLENETLKEAYLRHEKALCRN